MTFSLMIQVLLPMSEKCISCRILPDFSQDGYHCAPFKSQNMALNSGITRDGKEMGGRRSFRRKLPV